jgi:hypothetical protein
MTTGIHMWLFLLLNNMGTSNYIYLNSYVFYKFYWNKYSIEVMCIEKIQQNKCDSL